MNTIVIAGILLALFGVGFGWAIFKLTLLEIGIIYSFVGFVVVIAAIVFGALGEHEYWKLNALGMIISTIGLCLTKPVLTTKRCS